MGVFPIARSTIIEHITTDTAKVIVMAEEVLTIMIIDLTGIIELVLNLIMIATEIVSNAVFRLQHADISYI